MMNDFAGGQFSTNRRLSHAPSYVSLDASSVGGIKIRRSYRTTLGMFGHPTLPGFGKIVFMFGSLWNTCEKSVRSFPWATGDTEAPSVLDHRSGRNGLFPTYGPVRLLKCNHLIVKPLMVFHGCLNVLKTVSCGNAKLLHNLRNQLEAHSTLVRYLPLVSLEHYVLRVQPFPVVQPAHLLTSALDNSMHLLYQRQGAYAY